LFIVAFVLFVLEINYILVNFCFKIIEKKKTTAQCNLFKFSFNINNNKINKNKSGNQVARKFFDEIGNKRNKNLF